MKLYSWINLKNQYNINTVSSVDNSIIFTIIIAYLLLILMFNIASATFTSVEKSVDGIFGKIWGFICIVHSSVLCTPIQGYLLKIIISYFDGNSKLYTGNNKILSLVIITILLIFNTTYGLIIGKLCYHQLIVNDSQAMKHSNLQMLGFIYKILTISLLQISIENTRNWVVELITLLYLCIRLQLFYKTLPFYNLDMLKFFEHCTIFLIDLSIFASISLVLKGYDILLSPTSFFIMMILIYPIQIKIINDKFERNMLRVLSIPIQEINSPNEIILKFVLCSRITKNGAPQIDVIRDIKKDELYLQTMCSYYFNGRGRLILKEQNLENDFDKHFKSADEMNGESYTQLSTILKIVVLQAGIKIFPKNQLLKLLLIDFLMENTSQYHKSIFILASVNQI